MKLSLRTLLIATTLLPAVIGLGWKACVVSPAKPILYRIRLTDGCCLLGAQQCDDFDIEPDGNLIIHRFWYRKYDRLVLKGDYTISRVEHRGGVLVEVPVR